MQNNDEASENNDTIITTSTPKKKVANSSPLVNKGKSVVSSHIVTADSVQAEEVPTIPLGSLQTVSSLEPEVAVRSTATTKSVRLPAPLVVQPSEYRRSPGEWLQVWWEGIRPTYLPLALLPVLLGNTLAWTQSVTAKPPFGIFHIVHFVALLAAVSALQIGANLINDYYDYIRGIDTSNPLGPGGLIQQGLIRPTRILNFGLGFLILGTLIGAVVSLSAGPYVYLLGVIGLLCAFFYSATSRALSSLALGELVSFFIFGPLITLGAYFVQTDGATTRADLISVLLYSLPLGLLAAAVVHANNMRDVESDIQARKRTLAFLLGLLWSRTLYVLLVLGAYAIIVALGIPHGAPHLILITLWTLPILAVALSGVLRADMPASLHLVMRSTLQLATNFALLLMVSLILTTLFTVVFHLPSRLLPI